MSSLADLTLSQLATAYGCLCEIATNAKTFNCRSKALTRLEALMADKGFGIDDVFKAAGLPIAKEAAAEPETPMPETFPIEADEDGCEPEQIGPYGEDDIPNSGETLGDAGAAASADESTAEPQTPDPATILAGNKVVNDVRDLLTRYLIDSAGLDDETAVHAALRAVDALPPRRVLPIPPRRRADTKQAQLIDLLRRPQGSTIAELARTLGWAEPSVRGAIAGGIKKKLGLNVVSEKVEGARVYRIPNAA